MNSRLFLLLLFIFPLHAEEAVAPRTPASGSWKGRLPGTYIISRETDRRSTASPLPSVTYRKRMLVGVGIEGESYYRNFTSASPDGPWKESSGDNEVPPSRQVPDTTTKQTARFPSEPVTIGTLTVLCDVQETVYSNPEYTSRVREWKDPATNTVLRSDAFFDGLNADGKPVKRVRVLRTLGRSPRSIGSETFDCLVQERTGYSLGGTLVTRSWFHPAIPEGRIAFENSWIGESEPFFASEVIATGYAPVPADILERLASTLDGTTPAPVEAAPPRRPNPFERLLSRFVRR